MSNFEELTAIAQNVEGLSERGYTQSDFYQLILTLGKLSGILRNLNINSNNNILANDIVMMINKQPTFEQLLYYIATLIEILGNYYIANTKGEVEEDKVQVKFRRYRKKKSQKSGSNSDSGKESKEPKETEQPKEPKEPKETEQQDNEKEQNKEGESVNFIS